VFEAEKLRGLSRRGLPARVRQLRVQLPRFLHEPLVRHWLRLVPVLLHRLLDADESVAHQLLLQLSADIFQKFLILALHVFLILI
jgi:hypothetical protein